MDTENSAPEAAPTTLPVRNVRDPHDVEENKDLAAFSYLWIMSVIVYFAKRESPFIRFHAKQAMILFFLSILFAFIPTVGTFLEIIILAGMVFGFLNAAQGLWKDVPVIGPLSRGEKGFRETWKDVVHMVLKVFHMGKEAVKKEQAATMHAPQGSGDTTNPNPTPNPNPYT